MISRRHKREAYHNKDEKEAYGRGVTVWPKLLWRGNSLAQVKAGVELHMPFFFTAHKSFGIMQT